MNAVNIVWPTVTKLNPNGLQRLARVLHWALLGGAALCVVAAPGQGSDYYGPLALGAAGFVLFGRALRYVMAGE
jgi:hypothetical protein